MKQQQNNRLRILGVDREPPQEEIQGLDFIQADIRNQFLVELIKLEKIHTVCHLAFHENLQPTEMPITVLRFPSIIGLEADTPMVRFLRNPHAPVLLGFDPLMQVIHENDVIEALLFAVHNDRPGAYNIAAEGNLPLSRLMALALKIPIPVPHFIAYLSLLFLKSNPLPVKWNWPIEPDYLRYPATTASLPCAPPGSSPA